MSCSFVFEFISNIIIIGQKLLLLTRLLKSDYCISFSIFSGVISKRRSLKYKSARDNTPMGKKFWMEKVISEASDAAKKQKAAKKIITKKEWRAKKYWSMDGANETWNDWLISFLRWNARLSFFFTLFAYVGLIQRSNLWTHL